MKVVFSGAFSTQKQSTGVQRYAREILAELDKLILGSSSHFELLVPMYADHIPNYQNIRVIKKGNLPIALWNQIVLPNYAKRTGALCVDLCGSLPILKPDIVCIFDCISNLFPENYTTGAEKRRRLFYLLRARLCIIHCKLLIVISKQTQNDVLRLYHISPQKVRILYCGWQHIKDVVEDETIFEHFPQLKAKTYNMAMGNNHKTKNLSWIIETAKRNPDELFVVTGNRCGSADVALSNVVYTGFISDGQVKALMRGCKAYFQPSLYEGFGIPPLEAMYCGAKAVVSKASCFPEIYDDCAYYIDPYRPCDCLTDIFTQPISDCQKVLERYSWTRSAEKIIQIISERGINSCN